MRRHRFCCHSLNSLNIAPLPRCRFEETPTGTPRAGTQARERRSSITFVEEHSQLGSDLFGGSQRFGGAHLLNNANQGFCSPPPHCPRVSAAAHLRSILHPASAV